MRTYLHSGNLGDIIYAMPFIRDTGGGIVYIKPALYNESYDQYQAAKRLLETQSYITAVYPYPICPLFEYPIAVDYDLDLCRNQPRRGSIHLLRQYYHAFKVKYNTRTWTEPWIEPPPGALQMKSYTVINLTPRWREGSFVNWKHIIPTITGHKIFVGFDKEHEDFERKYGPIERVLCKDLMDMATLVYYSERVYCNQSVLLTLAQGLGKKYFLERKAGRKNCLMFTDRETILK